MLIYERKGLSPDILNGYSFGLKLNEQESDGGGRRTEDRGGCAGGGEEDEERGDGGGGCMQAEFSAGKKTSGRLRRSTNQLNK